MTLMYQFILPSTHQHVTHILFSKFSLFCKLSIGSMQGINMGPDEAKEMSGGRSRLFRRNSSSSLFCDLFWTCSVQLPVSPIYDHLGLLHNGHFLWANLSLHSAYLFRFVFADFGPFMLLVRGKDTKAQKLRECPMPDYTHTYIKDYFVV